MKDERIYKYARVNIYLVKNYMYLYEAIIIEFLSISLINGLSEKIQFGLFCLDDGISNLYELFNANI